MSTLVFLRVAILRLVHRKLLAVLLVLSTALAVGIVAAVPIFSGAVSLRIMQQELGLLEGPVRRPPFVVRFYAVPSQRQPLDIESAAYYRDWLANLLLRHVRVPIKATYLELQSPRWELMSRSGQDALSQEVRDTVYVVYAQDVDRHITIIDGVPFGEDHTPDALDVWLERGYAQEEALEVGDLYEVGDRYGDQVRIPIRVAGIWQATSPDADFWWYTEPIWHYEGILLTSASEYSAQVYPVLPIRSKFISWRFVLNDARMDLGRGEKYVAGLQQAQRDAAERLPGGTMDEAPTLYLIRGQLRKTGLTRVLLGFVVPLMGIIVYFIGALAALVVHYQRQEISMLNSRGASRPQIMALSLVETVILVIAAIPVGLLFGLALAWLLGHADGFLRFSAGAALPVYLAAVDWRLIVAAGLVAGLARLIPTWNASRLTVVAQERENARGSLALGATRWTLMFVMAAATWYAYRQLSNVGTLGLVSWTPDDRSHDPLLLLAPSLFLLTAPLFLAELFVLIVRPISWIGSLARWTPIYLGSTDLSRSGGHYRSAVYMLVLCLSLGVFYASLAKSADAWLLDRRRYEIGADLVYNPRGTSLVAGRFAKLDPERVTETPLSEMPFLMPVSDYEQVPQVIDAAPVGEFEAATIAGRTSAFVRLLGVDRLRFPRVTYFRPDYAAEPLGGLMNRLGIAQDGILVPAQMAEEMQLAEKDQILLNVLVDEDTRRQVKFTLVGTFDYFPTMFPDEAPVVVANLEYIQFQTAGVVPFGIWMRTEQKSNGAKVVQSIISALQIIPEYVGDLRTILAADAARLERLGIFGILSVCFLAGALLSALGLLMRSIVSLQARSLRFAVLQALGLNREHVLATVFVEYGVVLLFSVLAGTALGIVGAQRYVPFFQLTDSAQLPVPPYLPLIDRERALLLALVMIVALVVAQLAILVRLASTRLFEVLRMGTRE